jgi:hypothetical protein
LLNHWLGSWARLGLCWTAWSPTAWPRWTYPDSTCWTTTSRAERWYGNWQWGHWLSNVLINCFYFIALGRWGWSVVFVWFYLFCCL